MAGDPKELFPVEYWRLNVGGGEADGLFMTAQLPSLNLMSQRLDHVGSKAVPESTTVNVKAQWTQLSLTRGVDKKGTLWTWIEQGLKDKGGGAAKIEKKIVTVELCDSADAPVQTWTFTGAWPTSYQGTHLDSNSGQYAIETIAFEFDSAEVKYAGG
ncbi:MAG: hypothetical protein QOE86_710 [Solirubrobacteraceae bacterium]|jgi:phage tail-like protein|nr:hypothetical protein [Solirubrobacteraceae bacterium]